MTTYRHTFPEPIPADAPVRFLTDAGRGQITGLEWDMPSPQPFDLRRRAPEDARERLLSSPLPPDIASALADEMTAEG